MFTRPQVLGAWSLGDRVQASDGDAGDAFGSAVAADGSVVLVGAPDDEDAASGAGSAYIYESPIFNDGFETVDENRYPRSRARWSLRSFGAPHRLPIENLRSPNIGRSSS